MERYPKVLEINGALVALYPVEALKAVSIDVRFRAGSWYETGEKYGKAHLLEHMIFQGTESFANSNAMEIFKEENGIWNNAWTSGSQIEFAWRMPGQPIDQGMFLIEEMLFKANIPERFLEKEKKVISQEYEDAWSRPGKRFWKKEMDHYFGSGHAYTRDGLGSKDCFELAAREELLDYAKAKLVPANMTLAVVGNFDADKMEEKVRKLLDRDPGIKSELKVDKPVGGKGRLVHYEADMTNVKLNIGWLTKGMDEASWRDRIKLGTASYLLGGGPRSILFKTIREELGLVYGISCDNDPYPQKAGLWEIGTSVKKENVEMVIEKVLELQKNFIDKAIDEPVLERAKNYAVMQKQMAYESTMGTAGSLSGSLFWEGRVMLPEEFEDLIRKITESEIREAVREIVGEKDPMVAMMMSE